MNKSISRRQHLWIVGLVLLMPLVFAQSEVWAQDETAGAPDPPKIAEASEEGKLAISAFKYPQELKVELFAAEPDVANPVAIHVDPRGRVFVCETFRQEEGVEDNRNHQEWMDDELAAQTVQDRINYILKYEKDASKTYTAKDDRIRLLTDTDGDGVADKSQVFTDRYNNIADGTGAGVLSVGDDVFYTNIPHLWRLRDTDGDGVADQRKSLIEGFGVRFAFRGHDMHGLIVGPDHRLYFSIGDRGYNVSPEIHDATSGAVFSCELDGSDLQVVATGLRNPQELAFDDYGNLFTGDNNSDSGDKARWVYVVPGGDSGWRMYYQYLSDRGPFNRERIWEPYNEDTPAYIVPPIANIGDGPSGIAFYPGTGLSDFFKDRFFYCDFRGVANVSGVRTFKLKPKGAGFEVTDMDQTLWNTLPTDIDFGPDGKVYVSDWVFGWRGEGKGRIYTYHDPKAIQSDLVKETKTLLTRGVGKETEERLVELMGHADRRVRMAAQFELVNRERADVLLGALAGNSFEDLDQPFPKAPFKTVPKGNSQDELRRIHAVWGYQRLASKGLDHRVGKGRFLVRLSVVDAFGSDNVETNPEIRALAIKLAGELGKPPLGDEYKSLLPALQDESSRVRFMAAMSLGKIGDAKHLPAIAKMIAANNDKDPYLRHGGIMGFAGILSRMKPKQQKEILDAPFISDSDPCQLAVVVALRKIKSPLVARYLKSENKKIVLEAARAIHDDLIYSKPTRENDDVFRLLKSNEKINACLQSLADLIDAPIENEQLLRRVVNANFILGDLKIGHIVGAHFGHGTMGFLIHGAVDPELSREALELMRNWASPEPRDYVLGNWRPIRGERDIAPVKKFLAQMYHRFGGESELGSRLIEVCDELDCELDPKILQATSLKSKNVSSRIASVRALAKRDPKMHREVVLELAENLEDLPDQLSTVVIEQLVALDQERAVDVLQNVVESESASVLRKQLSYKTLGSLTDDRSAKILVDAFDRLLAGEVPAVTQLDVMMAAKNRGESELKNRVSKVEAAAAESEDKLAAYKFSLEGGNVERGSKIFYDKTEVYCTRCHLVDDWGGAVGPELSTIGKEKDRRYLLESIVDPNKVIAEGFNQIIVLTDEGDTIVGIKKSEDENTLTLMDKDGKLIPINKDTIEGSKKGQSSMPEDLTKHLTKSEVRDLVEFLASRQKKASKKAKAAETEHK